ncbi:hypothetical protein MLD38_018634 [Melastoma candidum]|uniref:Uncharacterized protein n=1 Tax=Melastoma candidum TaxID=119954 RepID=A0ACB9R2P8_9MYRT|nr:hypothetical protein MLD38_018634 [Melastoma candidum]
MDWFSPVDDWELRAVVRGCPGVVEEPPRHDLLGCFDLLDGFPRFDDIHAILYDLEEDAFDTSGADSAGSPCGLIPEEALKRERVDALELDLGVEERSQLMQLETSCVDGRGKQRRRRRCQHKSVVHHVTAEGITADMWAWRKYGQKPIKGSPYTRSYYRCSSSKGCLAKKQVERSSLDPGVFIITYTGEHAHMQPTRRNPLAGISRKIKSSTSSSSRSSTPPSFLSNTAQSTLPRSSSTPESPGTNLFNSMCFSDQLDEMAAGFAAR